MDSRTRIEQHDDDRDEVREREPTGFDEIDEIHIESSRVDTNDVLPIDEYDEGTDWGEENIHETTDWGPWYERVDEKEFHHISYDVKYCKMLWVDFKEAWIAILLRLVPNLRDLDIKQAPAHPNALPWRAQPSQLPRLKLLILDADSGTQRWPLGFMQDLLLNPELQTLRAFCGSGGWRYNYETDLFISLPPTLSPSSTDITRLELERCAFSKEDMQVIINAPNFLRVFHYTAGGTDSDPTNFTLPELVDMLSSHEAT